MTIHFRQHQKLYTHFYIRDVHNILFTILFTIHQHTQTGQALVYSRVAELKKLSIMSLSLNNIEALLAGDPTRVNDKALMGFI